MLLSKLGSDGSIIEKIPPLAASYRITGTTTPVLIGSYVVDDGSYSEIDYSCSVVVPNNATTKVFALKAGPVTLATYDFASSAGGVFRVRIVKRNVNDSQWVTITYNGTVVYNRFNNAVVVDGKTLYLSVDLGDTATSCEIHGQVLKVRYE